MIYLVELFKLKEARGLATTWKVSKYGVISGPYLDTSHSSTKWICISLSIIKSHAGLWKLQNFLNLPSKLVMEKWKAGGTIMIYIWMELILCILASKLLAWINFHKLTSTVIQKPKVEFWYGFCMDQILRLSQNVSEKAELFPHKNFTI